MALKGETSLLLGNLLFATNGLWVTLAPEGSGAASLAGARMALGCAILFAWLALKGRKVPLSGWDVKYLLGYALSLFGFQLCLFQAILTVGVAVGVMTAVASAPIFTALLCWAFRKEKPRLIWYASTAAAIAGIAMINPVSTSGFGISGLLCPLGAGLFSAASFMTGGKIAKKGAPEANSPQAGVVLVTAVCALLFLPFAASEGLSWVLSAKGALCVLMLGVFNCALAYSLILSGLAKTPAGLAATIGLSEPMGASVIGIAFLGEPYTAMTLTGIALVIFAVGLLAFSKNSAQNGAGDPV